MELRYHDDPSSALLDRAERIYWSFKNQTDEAAAHQYKADKMYRAWDVAMDEVPKARATDLGVSQAKLVDAVCAELRAEGGAMQHASTWVSPTVSWFQRPLARSRQVALLVIQFQRKKSITGATRSETLVK